MSSKYDKVEQLYRQLVPRLSRPEYWDKMLRQIAPFWKLANFTEGMLLTEQLPNATAVASFEQWKKMGRYVKFREKSVMIFATRNGQVSSFQHIPMQINFDRQPTGRSELLTLFSLTALQKR